MRPRMTLMSILICLAGVIVVGWYLDWPHSSVEKLPWLRGKPLPSVVAALGPPSTQLEYTMENSPGGEFRVELYNSFPPNDPKTAQVRIKELVWHRPRYHVAVWMHLVDGEWIVVDTCRWKESIVF